MAIQTLKQHVTSTAPLTAGSRRHIETGSRRGYSAVIGALFLVGFLAYGVGFTMVNSVTGAPDYLAAMSAHQSTLVLGAFLMLLNTVVDIGKGVLFFPILERHGKRSALAYLAAISVQVVFLDIGVLCLLMLVPLGQYAVDVAGTTAAWATALGSLLTQGNTLAYHIGQATLSGGGIFMCLLLYRARLLPRVLSGWGVLGYAIHLGGSVAEIFGIHLSDLFLIPGGLFEVAMPIWLFVKGFQPEAYGERSDAPAALPVTA
jgi:hypothetical protein